MNESRPLSRRDRQPKIYKSVLFLRDSSQVFGLSSRCFSLGMDHKLTLKRYQQRDALAEMDSGLQQQDAPEGDARTRWSSGHNGC